VKTMQQVMDESPVLRAISQEIEDKTAERQRLLKAAARLTEEIDAAVGRHITETRRIRAERREQLARMREARDA